MPQRVHSRLRVFSASQGLLGTALLAWSAAAQPAPSLMTGTASWYGEAHRGKLMANGKAFNPDKFTAASWFYPLDTRLLVTCKMGNQEVKRVRVTVTDRGPAPRLVNNGRVIDLSHAAFEKLGPSAVGLLEVKVYPEPQNEPNTARAASVSCQKGATLSHQTQFCAVQGSEELARVPQRPGRAPKNKLP